MGGGGGEESVMAWLHYTIASAKAGDGVVTSYNDII